MSDLYGRRVAWKCPEHGVIPDVKAIQTLEERTSCADCGATCTQVEIGIDGQPVE